MQRGKIVKKGIGLLVVLALLGGCNSNAEREAAVDFTRQALEIEADRTVMMGFFYDLHWGRGASKFEYWLVQKYFMNGMVEATALEYLGSEDIGNFPDSPGFAGMRSLQAELLLLQCPSSLCPIKDSLAQIYNVEVEQGQLNKGYPEVTKDNVEKLAEEARRYSSWIDLPVRSPWGQAQLLRQQVYARWAEILQEHDIDLVEEGIGGVVP